MLDARSAAACNSRKDLSIARDIVPPRDETRFRLADDVTHETLGPGEDTVIQCLRNGQLYTCNETTALFLRAMDGRRTFGQIVDHLLERLDVSREVLSRDLAEVAARLLAEKIIVEAS